MPRYKTTWLDYRLPGGQEFAVAVCGYSGLVRHMTIGNDLIRRGFVKFEEVKAGHCQNGAHCLALHCPLNHSESEHLAHMLDMRTDEPADDEISGIWGTDSTVQAMVRLAKRVGDELPAELKKRHPANG